jgi:hypothetical protein
MYLDGKLQAPASIAYGAGASSYLIAPGTYNFMLAPSGTTKYNTNDNIDFGVGKNYLMFLVHTNDTIQPEVAEVALPTLGFDTSAVRFFDFSPNSQVLDIAFKLDSIYNPYIYQYDTTYHITSDTTYTVYTKRYYNDQYTNAGYKAFYKIPSGLYNFKLRYADSTLAIDSMELPLLPGKSYTIYTRGYMDSSGAPPLIIDTVLHN